MYPTSKLDIISKVRAAVRQTDFLKSDPARQHKVAVKFVEAFKQVNDVTPELIAFIFQKFNAYHLLTVSLEHETSNYIPFLTYIDVEKAAKECGFDKLYATIAKNLSERMNDTKYNIYRIGKDSFPETGRSSDQEKAASKTDFTALLKSASRSETLMKDAKRDYRFVKHAMDTVDKLNSTYNHLSEMYYHDRGLKEAINQSTLKFGKTARKIISVLEFNKKANLIGGEYTIDRPLLESMTDFRNTLDKYAELSEEMDTVEKALPEMTKNMKREDEKKLVHGDVIKVTKGVRSGLGVVPVGGTVTVIEVETENNLLKASQTKDGKEQELYIPMERLHKSGYTKVS